MRRLLHIWLLVVVTNSVTYVQAQDLGKADEPSTSTAVTKHEQPVRHVGFGIKRAMNDVLLDQKAIWTAPLRFRTSSFEWMVPFTFATAALIGSDTAITPHLPSNPDSIKKSQDFSNYGLAAIAGTAGSMYLLGRMKHDGRVEETGYLSGVAIADTYIVTTGLKSITRRERPTDGDGEGRFWHSGYSFPSQHAALSWSIASVLAHQYPGPLTKLFAYGTAGAISAARVTGRDHFTSDVVVGSALGWYIGRHVARAHSSDPEIDERWGTFSKGDRQESADPASLASTYVPLDSWIYPAFDRLAAMGYVQTGFLGIRPWTRLECARLISEARIAEIDGESTLLASVYDSLKREFSDESRALESAEDTGVQIESLSVRTIGISGAPLRDGYHFAQTITNDLGRPYAEGANAVAGFSARAQSGRLAFYARVEYQRSPEGVPFSPETVEAIAAADGVPSPQLLSTRPISRIQLQDAYVSLKLMAFQLSFGRQSQWWGPGTSPMISSTNASPITMLRFDQTSPKKLPSILRFLGPVRTQFFIGQLSGQQVISSSLGIVGQSGKSFDPQPYIHGEKVSFRPTENLEFSVSRTVMFGGPGFPVTLQTFWDSFISKSTSNSSNDPGDRRSGFDFSYRVPGLRKWLTVYTDSFTDDEISPIWYAGRAAWNPGIYLPQLPKLKRLDFRAEGMFTPPRHDWFPGFYYFNVRYRSGYTNQGMLMANWVGREGMGLQLSTTYWMSARNKVQLQFRDMQVDRDFLKGGRLQDFKVSSEILLRPDTSLSSAFQYERWNFPLLAAGTKSNFTAAVQLTYWPRWRIK